mmetsp:Transcript_6510/g.13057  ORF Transcript_6510/g.13057 Transcript_6510/m.13057 type:complete len:81 (+) Transcript_6510:147-389(+)
MEEQTTPFPIPERANLSCQATLRSKDSVIHGSIRNRGNGYRMESYRSNRKFSVNLSCIPAPAQNSLNEAAHSREDVHEGA